MRATLEGNLDLPSSGLRFLLAFLFARGAMGLINLLVRSYQDASTKTLIEKTRLHATPYDQTEAGRRKSDRPIKDELDPETSDQ